MTLQRWMAVGFALCGGIALMSVGTPARAQWHDRNIHHFRDHDFDRWRGGRWIHGAHGGRTGWWWVVGGGWYFYPAPVYPYPNPYVPPVVAAPPPAVVTAPPAQYYFCDRPRGYYPYVAACRVPWRVVVAPP